MANPAIAGNAAYAFADQADVLRQCAPGRRRRGRDQDGPARMVLGVNPANGEIYFTLTNNSNRRVEPSGRRQVAPDAANPRVYTDLQGTTAQPAIRTATSCA